MGLYWEWDPKEGMVFGWDGKNEIEERKVSRMLEEGKHLRFHVSHYEEVSPK